MASRSSIDANYQQLDDDVLCGCMHEAVEPHTCPFADEINDDQSRCTCCEECTHDCSHEAEFAGCLEAAILE